MPQPSKSSASTEVSIQRHEGTRMDEAIDQLAVEEPLEIRITVGPRENRESRSIAVTMRTPTGHDTELAVGFLVGEGIVREPADVERVTESAAPREGASPQPNLTLLELAPHVALNIAHLERHFFTNSSCGVCGKTTIDALAMNCTTLITADFTVAPDILHALPETLRSAQSVFDRTGGLHAAALFDLSGRLVAVREDVGRHNSLDKLIGSQFLAGKLPLSGRLLLVSGRASYELLQKTIMAGIPLIAAVGAPSSLAVDLAKQFNVTLIGFLRQNRFNIYAGEARIASPVLAGRNDEPNH